MFGGKLRTWMEAHIVRAKKKGSKRDQQQQQQLQLQQQLQQQQLQQHQHQQHQHIQHLQQHHLNGYGLATVLDDEAATPVRHNGLTQNSKHSCSSGSAGSSSGAGGSLEAMLVGSSSSSSQQNGAHGQGANGGQGGQGGANGGQGASLSSPESAYSTGYSTDGTSPGASFPPEYYINIRTGTHYFQQHQNHQLHQQQQAHQQQLLLQQAQLRPGASGVGAGTSQSQAQVLGLLGNVGVAAVASTSVRPAPPPRLPPRQVEFLLNRASPVPGKKDPPKRSIPPGHRRSESCDIVRIPPPKVPPAQSDEPTSLIIIPNLAVNPSPSPRQRSRIRTNPWVPNSVVGTASSSSSFGRPDGMHESASSGSNGFKSGSGSDSTAKRQHPSHAKDPKKGILVSGKDHGSPVVRSPVPSVTWSPRRLGITVSSSSSGSRRSSDEDLTLHEMMGKYDESYVYERETDILSDSDPTDCEDCADTDADTGLDGGDEQDPEDLDFIDKDSFQDLNIPDTERGPRRLGHNSYYYHLPNELSRKLSRHRECSARRAANAARRGAKSRPGPKRRRPKDASASRSLGGTPVSNRRKPTDGIPEMRNHSPARLAMQRTLFIEDSRIDSVKRRSNSISYVSRSCEVRQSIPGGNYLANFDSEMALIEADKEADKKYKELILEAEHILVSMKASTPILGSPRRALNNPPANKRVEILRNTEIDLVPKVRGVDSIPGSPKFGSSPRFSPKKNHITNFMQINSPELSRRESSNPNDNMYSSPKKQLLIHSPPVAQRHISPKTPDVNRLGVCPNSPKMLRKSPVNSLKRLENGNSPLPGYKMNHSKNALCRPATPQSGSPLNIDDDSDDSTEKETTPNLSDKQIIESIAFQESIKNLTSFDKNKKSSVPPLHVDSQSGDSSSLIGGTSSSSEGDGELNKKRTKDKRPPLMTFRSVDIGHRAPNSSYCPQSEPVKRKVYSCSATFDRLQKSLEPHHLIRQKSDGEASTDERGSAPNCNVLNGNVLQSHMEKLGLDENQNSDSTEQDGQKLTLFRRQMLLQTIEGLKRSLEDQSASLKKTYHEPKCENVQSY